MASIAREDLEFFVTSAEGKELELSLRTGMYTLLVLTRIEGHLDNIANTLDSIRTNTIETPGLDRLATTMEAMRKHGLTIEKAY